MSCSLVNLTQAFRCLCNKSHATPPNRFLNQEVRCRGLNLHFLPFAAICFCYFWGSWKVSIILKVMKCGLIFSNRSGFALKIREKCKYVQKVNKQVLVVTSPSVPQRALFLPHLLCVCVVVVSHHGLACHFSLSIHRRLLGNNSLLPTWSAAAALNSVVSSYFRSWITF